MNNLARRLAAVALFLASVIVIGAILLVLAAYPVLTHYLGTGVAGVGALAGWAFVVLYWPMAWRKYPEGIHVMKFTAGLAAIMSYLAIVNTVDDSVVREGSIEVVRFGIFAFVSYMMVERLALIVKARQWTIERIGGDK